MGCGAGQGQAEVVALLAQVGVVWGCLWVGDLAVDFPGGVAFEAAHDSRLLLPSAVRLAT